MPRLLGRPVGDLSAKRRIGYLPENPYFYDYLTAEELLALFRRPVRLPRRRAHARASAACSTKSASARERRLQLRKFSKGMLQRVGIAQALINDPELVIFDEPMSGLDPLGRRDVRALILRLRDRGCTVFFSSHVLSDAEALCSRVAILARGRLLTTGRLDARCWRSMRTAGSWSPPRSPSRCCELDAAAPAASSRIGEGATRSNCRSSRRPIGCSPSSPPPAPTLVSLNPMRETLEEFFVQQVSAPESSPPIAAWTTAAGRSAS